MEMKDGVLISQRRCADCRYASEERPQRDMITPILFCRHGPMQPVVIGVGGNGAPVIRAVAPAVAPEDWCYRYEARTLPAH